MRIAIITKESMYKLVKTYAGSEYEKDNEDEMCCRLSVKVDKEFVEFEVSVDLMELCGMVVE